MKHTYIQSCLLSILLMGILGCETPEVPKSQGTPKSSNADLSDLEVTHGLLNPGFQPGITNYTVSVPNATTTITVTGTLADSKATISSNNGIPQVLSVGTNSIQITVTAEDGTTKKHYVVLVTRAGSSNSSLANLTLSTGTLTPGFTPGTLSYTVTVPNATNAITITGVKSDSQASLNGVSGTAQNLSVGMNSFTITVTSQDLSSTTNYVIKVFRWGADLSSATLGTLKYVPAGRFQRDATSTNVSVITKPFWVTPYEITRAQYLAVVGYDPSSLVYSTGTSDPVQAVRWYHGLVFCNKLSLAEGLTPVYSVKVGGVEVDWASIQHTDVPSVDNSDWNAVTVNWTNNGYRLLTEMEWMWSAMGAPLDGQGDLPNTTGYQKAFSGSSGTNAKGDYAVFGYGSGQAGATTVNKTSPVGSKLPNELGLYDLSGNVWEWCWDWSASYPAGTLTDYKGASSGLERVLRGNGFSSVDCRVALTNGEPSYYCNVNLGFRVAR